MRIKELSLTKRQKMELEFTAEFDTRAFMQKRSRIILMKADGLSSREIARALSISEPLVNRWVSRYREKGFAGLRNKTEQGAKPIMDPSDEIAVREAIDKDRLSLMKAKERWQHATGKEASRSTFRNFYQSWCKIWRYKETSEGETLAATL